MKLADYIRNYREEHNLSQRQFADICGLSNGYISLLEKGENPKTMLPVTPTLPALNKIASGTGVSLTRLLSDIDDMNVDISFNSNPTQWNEGGALDKTTSDIISIIGTLSPNKKLEALRYIKYLAGHKE